jgi:iron complex transport system substrate-binding protein
MDSFMFLKDFFTTELSMNKIAPPTVVCILLLCFFSAGAAPRIVSLSPAIDNYISALNAEHMLVGTTSYSRFASHNDITVVGDVLTINVESILSLNPTQVVTTPITPERKIQTLRSIGVEVLVFEKPQSFDHLCEQFIRLAGTIGKDEPAEKTVREARSRAEELHAQNAGKEPLPVFFQIGMDPLFTVTSHSFIHDYMHFTGCINIAADAQSGNYSKEEVVSRNPFAILSTDMGQEKETIHAYWERFPHMDAVAENRIFILPADSIASPNPAMFIAMLERINTLLRSN